MSLRGIKKQLYRTPHQLFGSKSADNALIKQWENDLATAITGLEFLQMEEKKWSKFWVSSLTNFVDIVESFKDIHSLLTEDDETLKRRKKSILKNREKGIYDVNDEVDDTRHADTEEEMTKITMHELNQASRMGKTLLREIAGKCEINSKSFVNKCDDMISILKAAQKLVTKRNHKKIDLDMQNKKVDSLLKITNDPKASDKDKSNLEIHNEKLTETQIIFQDFDQKTKTIIPQVLASLSEFIYKLTMKLYFFQRDIHNTISRNLCKFTLSQGISSSDSLTYDDVLDEFKNANSRAMEKLESLVLLKDFREFREKNLREKTVKSVNEVAGSVVGTTASLSSTIYTKTTKPGQKVNVSLKSAPSLHNPVRPFDKDGIFSTASDPITFMKQTSVVHELSNSPNAALSLSQFPSTEADEVVNINNKPVANDTNWMKPLRNPKARLSTVLSDSQTVDPMISTGTLTEKELPSVPPISPPLSSETPSTAQSRVSSAVTNKQSETFRVANVTMNKIRQQMTDVIMNPNIDHCPITASRGIDVDEELRNYIVARSSLTSQLFSF